MLSWYALIGQYVDFTFSLQIAGMKTYKYDARIHIHLPRENIECKPISNRSFLVTAIGSEFPAAVGSLPVRHRTKTSYQLILEFTLNG